MIRRKCAVWGSTMHAAHRLPPNRDLDNRRQSGTGRREWIDATNRLLLSPTAPTSGSRPSRPSAAWSSTSVNFGGWLVGAS